ncbi:MAG TPA: Gfo/Idh/MocA family oxidoreductase [Candidatus Latescibacteria bacterium]|nr:Gfo/Idh/MocA family oxidoreductase [Candidatus Latescibacterota bacterium]
MWDGKLDVLVIGGGMISEEVILPTLFQERREGRVGEVLVATRRPATISHLRDAFPGKEFKGYPDPDRFPPEGSYPRSYIDALGDLGEHAAVIVATPDHLHTEMVLAAIEAGRDVIVEKPLCLRTEEALKIKRSAEEGGIYVYTDYHKRHDRAIRAVRYKYRRGELGELLHGHAWIEEKREMPLKVFSRWAERSSPFEYIGVHYVDAYYFITGLLPKRVVAFGQKKLLPRYGKEAYDAVQAVVEWEDCSVLWVQTSWVCSERNTALTNQGLQLLGTEGEHWADHKDRNCRFVTQEHGPEDYNPNFFKAYDSMDHPGEVDYVGYGYDSIVQGLEDIRRILRETEGLPSDEALSVRREILKELEPLRPLPSQALVGVAVVEAVRMSLENGNRFVRFDRELRPNLL